MQAHEKNRKSWNAVTPAHNSHKADQARFFAEGGCTLFPEELDLLGDVEGRALLHLQCNCGQDSLSLAGRGARVTGVDIADEAIAFARTLSAQSGVPAEFVRSDLFDYFAEGPAASFDLAFSSYGTFGWLSDLGPWGRGIHRALRPGGRFVLVDFHPMCWGVRADGTIAEPYFFEGVIDDAGVSDYVGRSGPGLTPSGWQEGVQAFENPEPTAQFQWTLAQVVQSLLDAGLVLETLREYPYSRGCQLHEGMVEIEPRTYAMPPTMPNVPLMFALAARRPV